MPCLPLKKVKNVRIRPSLMLNLDYFNPVAALRLQITSIPALKDNSTFCPARTDSTAQKTKRDSFLIGSGVIREAAAHRSKNNIPKIRLDLIDYNLSDFS